jgi:hypothetical protein
VKVYDASNNTDIQAFSRSETPTQDAFSAGITNDRLHIWAVFWDGINIRHVNRRDLNATIIAWGNDTSEASVIGDTLIKTDISAVTTRVFASCPGYFAIAAVGTIKTTISIFSTTGSMLTDISTTTTFEQELLVHVLLMMELLSKEPLTLKLVGLTKSLFFSMRASLLVRPNVLLHGLCRSSIQLVSI